MRVTRIGFTPLKGGRHVEHPAADLALTGPVGDRTLCLVDPDRARVVRTVENPAMLRTVAELRAGVLTLTLPSTTIEGTPAPTGEFTKVDYWGRVVEVELLDGPWSRALSEHLGYDVRLARPRHPGDVVYGAAVSLVTTSALARLADALGRSVDPARFRATLVVDTPGADPDVERSWRGRELEVGGARLRIRDVVPRCAVVDRDPVSGLRDAPVLETLAGYGRDEGGISFGVDAVVVQPGRVSAGDAVTLGRG